MIKKSLIFAVTLFASVSLVEVASAQISPFEGFYAGGQVGYSSIENRNSGDSDGYGGGGYIGYGFGGIFDQIYGAVEADFGYDGASSTLPIPGLPVSPTNTFDIEYTSTIGLNGRFGGVIDNSLLIYGCAGLVHTTRKETSNNSLIASSETSEVGFRFGGGAEMLVTENISARAEFTYTSYYRLFGPNIGQVQLRIGAAYHF